MTIDTAPDPSPMQRVARAIPPDARVTHWRAADGWAVRRFDRDGAGRGAILFQAGRADMFEKYLESFDHWHAAGWSVTAFDWRGQGGSGRLGADPHVGHCASFAPWIDDLAGFWRDWRAGRAGPAVLMGHSMGGYLALRAMVEGRVAPDAAVLVAPMLGLHFAGIYWYQGETNADHPHRYARCSTAQIAQWRGDMSRAASRASGTPPESPIPFVLTQLAPKAAKRTAITTTNTT